MKRASTILALLGVLVLGRVAQAQPLDILDEMVPMTDDERRRQKVDLTVRGLYHMDLAGSAAVRERAYNPVLISAKNQTTRQLRGKVVIEITTHSMPPTRHETPLDLPPGETRDAQITLFVPDRVVRLKTYYETSSFTTRLRDLPSAANRFDLVALLIPQSSELRSGMHDLVEELPNETEVSIIPLDSTSGDPVLPRVSAGWAPVTLLVTNVALMDRADESERNAFLRWIRAGGQALFMIDNVDDLRRPWLMSMMGPMELVSAAEDDGSETLLQGGEGVLHEFFGISKQVGFGRIYLSHSPLSTSQNFSEAIRSIVYDIRERWVTDFGLSYRQQYRGLETDLEGIAFMLNPNQSYRLAILAVALVLLFYVILVGPLNFIVVRRLRRPTLALVTTPILALLALVSIGVVGVAQKGVSLRARTIEIDMMSDGDPRGTSRTYTGLFHGRPVEFDLEWPPSGMMRIARTQGGESIDAIEYGGGPPLYRGVSGSFWSTIFVVEENFIDAGGAVSFEREGDDIIAVTNGTELDIIGSLLISSDVMEARRVGPIEPGQRVEVANTSATTGMPSVLHRIGPPPLNPTRDEQTVAQLLGLSGEGELRLVRGLLRSGVGRTPDLRPISPRDNVPRRWLYLARLQPVSRGVVAGLFEPDLDMRFLWVRGATKTLVRQRDVELDQDHLSPESHRRLPIEPPPPEIDRASPPSPLDASVDSRPDAEAP